MLNSYNEKDKKVKSETDEQVESYQEDFVCSPEFEEGCKEVEQ